jgi:TolB protein
MSFKIKKFFLYLFGIIFVFNNIFVSYTDAAVDVYIKIVREGKRLNVGISKFVSKDINYKSVAKDVQQVLVDDLMFTRIFNIVEPGWQYLPKKEISEKWLSYNLNVVVCGVIEVVGDEYILYGSMYDLETTEKIYESKFVSKDIRYLAHIFSDNIVRYFTGEYGIATTKIFFVNDMSGSKEIYSIDYDGYNLTRITYDNNINIYPRVSPDGEKIIFTSYRYGNPDLCLLNLLTRKKTILSNRQGLNITANWSFDGTKIVVTLTQAKHLPNIFLLDLNGNIVRRLTLGRNVDVSAYFSPNDREIVFVSDRAGFPQLYISDLDGLNFRRLNTSSYTDSPCWSPKGDKIVFCMKNERSLFDIFLYDISKNQYYRLTQDSGSNENPYFSPDGRFIVFSSNRFGKYELFTMFLDGSNQRRVAQIKGNSYTPCWSPRYLKN